MTTILIIVVLVLLLGGGGFGYSRYGVAGGVGPLGILVIVLLALYFTGNLHR